MFIISLFTGTIYISEDLHLQPSLIEAKEIQYFINLNYRFQNSMLKLKCDVPFPQILRHHFCMFNLWPAPYPHTVFYNATVYHILVYICNLVNKYSICLFTSSLHVFVYYSCYSQLTARVCLCYYWIIFHIFKALFQFFHIAFNSNLAASNPVWYNPQK